MPSQIVTDRFLGVLDRFANGILKAAHPTGRLVSQECRPRPANVAGGAVMIDCYVNWRDLARHPKTLVLTYAVNGSPAGVGSVTVSTDDGTAFIAAKGVKAGAAKWFAYKYGEKSPMFATIIALGDSSVSVTELVGLLLRFAANNPPK